MSRSAEARRPSATSLEVVRRVAEAVAPDDPALAAWYAGYARQHARRLAHDLDYVERFAAKGARIVEFGASPPILTAAMKRRGLDVTGVDIAPERFGRAIEAEGLDVVRADIETGTLPFPDEAFDAALFNEIFEHLRINPIRTLREVRRVLRPGGLLFLSTPNLTSLGGWYGLLVRGRSPDDLHTEYLKLERLGHMGHVRQYTAGDVRVFLERNGFVVEQTIYRGEITTRSPVKRLLVGSLARAVPSLRPHFSLVARRTDGPLPDDGPAGPLGD